MIRQSLSVAGEAAGYSPIERVISRLIEHGCEPRSAGPSSWESHCPAHRGSRWNLSVRQNSDRAVLLRCHHVGESGETCSTEAIVEALGLVMRDLFPSKIGVPRVKARTKSKPAFASPEACCESHDRYVKDGRRLTELWTYHGRDGEPVMAVARREPPDRPVEKAYLPMHRTDRGWVTGDPAGPLPLYRLPDLDGADGPVWVLEGEKCADEARRLGLVATTSAHGASAARKADWRPLAGRSVFIVPDNDPTGESYAQSVLEALRTLEPPAVVKVVKLPVNGPGEDLFDWTHEAGPEQWELEDFRRELERLAEQAPLADLAAMTARDAEKSQPAGDGQALRPNIRAELKLADLGRPLDQVEVETVEWLAEYRCAKGKFHLNIGPGGVGKSTFALTKAAALTVGGCYPGGPQFKESGLVALLAAEDAPEDTIKPRFVAAGGDPAKLFILNASAVAKDAQGRKVALAANFQDLDYWNRVFDLWPAKMLIVDPIQAFMGRGVQDNKNAEVRAVLEPFLKLLRERDVTLEAITHTPKKIESRNAAELAIDSVAYPNLARVVYVHWNDPEQREHYLVTNPKMWHGRKQPAIGYRIEGCECEIDCKRIETSRIVCDEHAPDVDDADLLNGGAGRSKTTKDGINIAEATAWLKNRLANGPIGSLACAIQGDEVFGVPLVTGKSEAERRKRFARIKWWRDEILKKELNGGARRLGFGPGGTWFFWLPGSPWPPSTMDSETAKQFEDLYSDE